MRKYLLLACTAALVLSGLVVAAAASAERRLADPLVIYSGRGKRLIEPLLERFTAQTGIEVRVRYAGSTDLATLLLQEKRRTPADVFFSQDPGALGAVSEAGLLAPLPREALERVPETYRAVDGDWVGVSGRARVIAWSTDRLAGEQIPDSVFELTDPRWRGRIGWAPANASFQLFITAMRHQYGQERTRRWLLDMRANEVRDYPSNRPIIQAIADGAVDLGLVNHYYLTGFKRDQGEDFPVANHFPEHDVGGLMSVAGVGVLASSDKGDRAQRFVRFLLSENAQRYFADQIGEFPLATGVEGAPAPGEAMRIDLGSLSDLQGTLNLLRETNVLP